MTDMHMKRKYAGEPHKDVRAAKAPDVERLPPHKKPKVWMLTVQWTETVTRQMVKQFPSKAARDESRARVERHFREEAARPKGRKYYRWAGYYNSPLSAFDERESKAVKVGPEYFESYEERAPEPQRGRSERPSGLPGRLRNLVTGKCR